MFGARLRPAAASLNRTLGEDILPPLLVTFGLSVMLQNALLAALLRRQPPLPAGALETASSPSAAASPSA